MELEAPHNTLEGANALWDEFDAIFHMPCDTHAAIDNVLRAYLELTTKYKGVFCGFFVLYSSQEGRFLVHFKRKVAKDTLVSSENEISHCLERLLASELFVANADYIRRQIIYSLLQDDAPDILYVTVSFLLFDGRQNEHTFEMMNKEGAFVRLLELIQSQERLDGDGAAGLHRLLMNLMYEMCRIQRIKIGDLVLVDDDFVKHLFEIIEELSGDIDDPYHYPVIRVLLVLNEQFMVSAHDPLPERSSSAPLTNKVIKVLSMFGSTFKTFGENIILLLNRETETSLQLLTLKLLYLLFTTPPTYEYFYTNDLRVLVDILIRNLLDLPEEAAALRHTYLRVLYPLLAHTQLRYPPHYKREELRKLLGILVRGEFSFDSEECERILHFDDVDETTKRLVLRCGQVDWLAEHEVPEQKPKPESIAEASMGKYIEETGSPTTTSSTSPEPSSPHRLSRCRSSRVKSSPITLKPAKELGMNLEIARSSEASVVEVAAHKEKPGVMVPSRNAAPKAPPAPPPPKQKPQPPKARRWRGRREQQEGDESSGQKTADGAQLAALGRNSPDSRKSSGSSGSAPPPTTPTDSVRTSGDMSSTRTAADELLVPTIVVPKARTPNPPTTSHAPALPPPRRSSHSVPPKCHGSPHSIPHRHRQPPPPPLHHNPYNSEKLNPAFQSPCSTHLPPSPVSPATSPSNGHITPSQKPEPPKTRRWRGKSSQQIVDGKPPGDAAPTTGNTIAHNNDNIDSTEKCNGLRSDHERRAVAASLLETSATCAHDTTGGAESVNRIEDGVGRLKVGQGG
ncbi:hypothetical protein BDBG_00357 [Blastomyces gilchristii SLH14081]|uniref:SPIN90/Ldb17 leucine-rich domain-containing protein n=1 Tax=Blastomyces gilchristii (strain SLH14081) TaxID=559298 RepID=A0A179UAW3_BLAGS|nr:uncharacterized protein BDBG_00357 [Blastomyces gilchristii SLH14081]OAT03662.1 hypothetical protein BDBG_00357 [Blastomyces gilchristii SLH14081]